MGGGRTGDLGSLTFSGDEDSEIGVTGGGPKEVLIQGAICVPREVEMGRLENIDQYEISKGWYLTVMLWPGQ